MNAQRPTKAMIMAAGLGTRMRPLTNDKPKPMVCVAGKPLIDHAIDRLAAAGVKTIAVNVHYRAELLKEHLQRRSDGVKIYISEETDELLGTGGGVVKALHYFGDEAFFIHNSDSIWNEGYGHALDRMIARWSPDEMDGLLLMASLVSTIGYEGVGDFVMDADGRLARVPEARVSPFAFPGVQIVHPRLFSDPPKGAFSTNVVWDRAIAKGRLFGIRLEGTWMHIGTVEALEESEAFLADSLPHAGHRH
jgi:N-acetyl-alpha-D-muramate 1-phosphate uridylyltransferase